MGNEQMKLSYLNFCKCECTLLLRATYTPAPFKKSKSCIFYYYTPKKNTDHDSVQVSSSPRLIASRSPFNEPNSWKTCYLDTDSTSILPFFFHSFTDFRFFFYFLIFCRHKYGKSWQYSLQCLARVTYLHR